MTGRGKHRLVALVCVLLAVSLVVGGLYLLRKYQRQRMATMAGVEGLAAYHAGDHAAALPKLAQYVSFNQDDLEYVLALADSRRHIPQPNNRHIATAILYFEHAATLAPEDPRPHTHLLDIYAASGAWGDLLNAAEGVLKRDPDSQHAHAARLAALVRLDRANEALELAERYEVENAADMEAAIAALRLATSVGEPVERLRERLAALQARFPQHPRPLVLLTMLEMQVGQFDAAYETLSKAIALPNDDPLLLDEVVAVADILRLRQRRDGEILREDLAEAALARGKDDESLRSAAHIIASARAWRRADGERAQQALLSAGRSLEPLPPSLAGWARFMIVQSGLSIALEERSEPDTSFGEEIVLQRTRAAWDDLIALTSNTESASLGPNERRMQLRQLTQNAAIPDDVRALAAYYLGRFEAEAAESDAAGDAYTLAWRLDPTFLRAAIDLAELWLSQGEVGRSIAVCTEALAGLRQTDGPATGTLVVIWAEGLLAAQELDEEALRYAVDLMESLREPPSHLVALRARLRFALGQIEEAQGDVETLIEGVDTLSTLALVRLIESAEQSDVAHPGLFSELQSRAARDGLASVFVARRLLSQGRDEAAMDTLGTAAAALEGREQAVVRLELAEALERKGLHAAAIEQLELASASAPGDPSIQRRVLSQPALWRPGGESILASSLQRLRGVAGDASITVHLIEARRLLQPSLSDDRSAAASRSAKAIIDHLAPVLQREPMNHQALRLRAEADLLQGDRASALTYLERAALTEDAPGPTLLRLAQVLQAAGRGREADERLDQLTRLDLRGELLRQRALLMSAQGRSAEAIDDLQTLVESGDGRFADRLMLCQLHDQRGDAQASETELARLLDSPSLSDSERVSIASWLASRGQTERGLAILDASANLAGVESQIRRALMLELAGDIEAARRTLAAAANSDTRALQEAVRLELRQFIQDPVGNAGAFDAARAHSAKLPQDNATSGRPEVRAAIQSAVTRNQRLAAALEALAEDDASPLIALADALRRAPDEQTTETNAAYVSALRRTVQQHPTFLPAYRMLTFALFQNGELDAARRTARAAAEAVPSDPSAHRLVIDLLLDPADQRWDEALPAARRWASTPGVSAQEADLLIAQIQTNRGNLDEAILLFRRHQDSMVADLPDEPEPPLTIYALALARAGQVAALRDLMWPLAEARPAYARGLAVLSGDLRASPEVVRDWLEQAARWVPSDPMSQLQLGVAWSALAQRTNQSEDHARVAEIIAPIVPDLPPAVNVHILLADAYHRMGELDRAESSYRSALATRPSDPNLNNNLAYLLTAAGETASEQHIAEAVKLAETAVREGDMQEYPRASRAEYRDTLARAMLEQGYMHARNGNAGLSRASFEGAVGIYQEATQLAPDALHLKVGHAEALLAIGEKEQAERIFNALGTLPTDLQERVERVRRMSHNLDR